MVKTKKSTHSRLIDLIIISSIILVSTLIISIFNLKLVPTSLLLFALPSLYLIFTKTKSLKRIFIATGVGTILGISFDLVGSSTGAWFVPLESTLFPYRLFGIVTIDGIVWFFTYIFFVLTFYEHFIDHDRSQTISSHFKRAFPFIIMAFLISIFLVFVFPDLLNLSYSFLFIALMNVPIVLWALFKHPSLSMKFLKTTAYFSFVLLLFEYIGLKNNQWSFPGSYVGTLQIVTVTVPFEEFFFWIFASTSIILSYYELFIHDGK